MAMRVNSFSEGIGQVLARCLLLGALCIFSSVSPARADITFSWSANPPEEYVFGYRFYYGPESRYDRSESGDFGLKSGFSYEYFIDLTFQLLCPAGSTDYGDCESLPPGVLSCNPLPTAWWGYQGNIECSIVGDLPTQVYFTMTAYNIFGAEGDYTNELIDSTQEIFVTRIRGNTNEYGRVRLFLVALTGLPTDDVTIGLSSSDPTEGTVYPSSLTFTGNNDWIQLVTVSGVEDDEVDGDIEYNIITAQAVSNDLNYSGLDPDDVTVTNEDNDADTAEILVHSVSNNTTEDGNNAIILVKLNSRPTADVTLGFSSDDTTEGTISSSYLTFTGNNDFFQVVTVAGVDDTVVDGDIEYNIITASAKSSDVKFAGLNPVDVAVINEDNDNDIFQWNIFLPAIIINGE